MRLGHDQTFASFVSSPSSAEAFGLATALARAEPDAPRLLLLCGPPGVGKTHLLRAIVDCARTRNSAASTAAMTADELVRRLIAWRVEGIPMFEVQQVDCLVVDDLHVLSGKPVTQAEVGRLLRTTVDRGGHVACASGGSVTGIQVLVDAVRASAVAKVVEVAPPQPHEMRRILVRHAAAVGLRLRAATTVALADHGRGDVRRAIGALTRLQFEQHLRTAAELR